MSSVPRWALAKVGGRLRVSFGPVFVPEVPQGRAARDGRVAAQVMAAIPGQMPGNELLRIVEGLGNG